MEIANSDKFYFEFVFTNSLVQDSAKHTWIPKNTNH